MNPVLPPVRMSIIRKILPELLAQELCSVQPMTSGVEIFNVRRSSDRRVFDMTETFKNGTLRHSFLTGWERYYHGEWIPHDLWLKIKIAGL